MADGVSGTSPGDLATYEAIIEGVPAMLWLGDPEGRCVFLNRAQRAFWGVDLADVATFDWTGTIHPDDVAALSEPYRVAMEARIGFEVEARYRRADGAWRVLRTRAEPRFDEAGTFLGMTGVNTDVTEQREAETRLTESNRQLEHALDASQGIGTFVWDLAAGQIRADRRFAATHGVDPDAAARGVPVEVFLEVVEPADMPLVERTMTRLAAEGGPYEAEYRIRVPGRPECWLFSKGAGDRVGAPPSRVSGATIDITDRKAQEQQLELLAQELSHRIKNIFAVVRAMTRMAGREAGAEAAGALGDLAERFAAMGAAYAQITPHARAAVAETTLHALFDTLFAPYRTSGERRIATDGDDRVLSPKAASSLALILHELATNASKYGALSTTGSVVLRHRPEGADLRLDWEETGGPAIDGPPARHSFGSRLIRLSAQQLDARIEEDWTPGGLVWTMRVPIDRLS